MGESSDLSAPGLSAASAFCAMNDAMTSHVADERRTSMLPSQAVIDRPAMLAASLAGFLLLLRALRIVGARFALSPFRGAGKGRWRRLCLCRWRHGDRRGGQQQDRDDAHGFRSDSDRCRSIYRNMRGAIN